MKDLTGYFDYAAATPLDDDAYAAMLPCMKFMFYNPSALYKQSLAARNELERFRRLVAGVLSVKPGEVVFTAGGSEANNLAIQGIMKRYPGGRVLYGAIEHDSVRQCAAAFDSGEVPVDETGTINLEILERLLAEDAVLVSVAFVNNETGTIQPLRRIAEIITAERQRRGANGLPLYLHTDASQAGNYLGLYPNSLGVDLMSINGGKLYGPKMSGCLYVRGGLQLEPLIYGGGQEAGLRSGTENLALIAGFATTLEKAQRGHKAESARVSALRDELVAGSQKLGGLLNASSKNRVAHIANISFPSQDNERLVMQLDERGFQVATGSACHARGSEKSYVLCALGYDDARINGSLRMSLGRYSTKAAVGSLIKALETILANS